METINTSVPTASIFTDLASGRLRGDSVVTAKKTVGDLAGYWHTAEALAGMNPLTPLYITETWYPIEDGTEGAVLWGNTTLYSGRVGHEYFMTRGHRHIKRTHGELVVCVNGRGALLLMNEERETRMEEMSPGSTHYIQGHNAHRTVNTGHEPLVFLCAWPADCGHVYEDVRQHGFSRLLLEVDGQPRLMQSDQLTRMNKGLD